MKCFKLNIFFEKLTRKLTWGHLFSKFYLLDFHLKSMIKKYYFKLFFKLQKAM